MNQNKLFTLLTAVVIVCIIIIAGQWFKVNKLRGDLEIRKIDLKKKDAQIKIKIDSIRLAKKHSIERDSMWSAIVKDQLNLLIAERAKTEKIRYRYETLKNTPVPVWSSSELDSIIADIIHRSH